MAATFLRGETRRGRGKISEASVNVESAELPRKCRGRKLTGKAGGGTMYSSLSDRFLAQSSSSLELKKDNISLTI